jgi:CRP/FNR family transcriptional regulator, cyclic AMP receptor protein
VTVQLLESLTEDGQRRVRQRANRYRFAAGAYIFHAGEAGDTLHMIESGRVAVLAGGAISEPVTLTILGPGQVFGELALLSLHNRRTATIRALTTTETLVLHRDDFEDLRRSHPTVDRFLLDLVASQVARLTDRMIENVELSATERIYRRIAELGDVFGVRGTDHPITGVSQAQLASMAGVQLRVTNDVLAKAQRDGVLTWARQRMSIRDWPRVYSRALLKPV